MITINNDVLMNIIEYFEKNDRLIFRSVSKKFYEIEESAFDNNVYKYYKKTKKKSYIYNDIYDKYNIEINDYDKIHTICLTNVNINLKSLSFIKKVPNLKCVKISSSLKILRTNASYAKQTEKTIKLFDCINNKSNLKQMEISKLPFINFNIFAVSLNILILNNICTYDIDLSHLINLKYLKIQNIHCKNDYLNLTLSDSIETLIIYNNFVELTMLNVPHELKILFLFGESQSYNSNFINMLPTNLKTLYMPLLKNIERVHLPNNLHTLILENNFIDVVQKLHFPMNLKKLYIKNDKIHNLIRLHECDIITKYNKNDLIIKYDNWYQPIEYEE